VKILLDIAKESTDWPPPQVEYTEQCVCNFPAQCHRGISFSTLSAQLPTFFSIHFPLSSYNHTTITNQQQILMIVSFNEPTTTIYTRQLLRFFVGIHIGLISQPVGLSGTFWAAIAMGIVNTVIYKGTASTMEHTLEFGHGQTN
jgi:hypothetical protein